MCVQAMKYELCDSAYESNALIFYLRLALYSQKRDSEIPANNVHLKIFFT